jgi:hypothetical protein
MPQVREKETPVFELDLAALILVHVTLTPQCYAKGMRVDALGVFIDLACFSFCICNKIRNAARLIDVAFITS